MRPIHPRIYTHLVTLWLALSLGGIVLGIVVWRRLNDSLDGSLRGASFRISLQNTHGKLVQAEAAAHAYSLTGNDTHRRAFLDAQSGFREEAETLYGLAVEPLALRSEVERLRAAGEEHLHALEGEIERRPPNTPATDPSAQQEALASQSEQLRDAVSRLEAYPEGLLAKHSNAARSELQRALSTTLAAGLFGLGAGVLAFYLSRVALQQETQKRELSEHALRAERASQDKSAFLANMSHEIRTPMNAILGFSELLVAELPQGARSRKHARSIYDAAQSLLQLINDILDLSKIEASMLELHLDPTDVRELRSFLQSVFAQQATRKGLRLEFDLDPSLPNALRVDRSRLRQILINLVSNAIKFTEKGSVTVRIAWLPDGELHPSGTLLFEVLDTGVGIPPEKQAQVFEPFVQVDTRRPFEQQGTGLGLSIVQRLTERMGGVVEVESVVGRGSTFRIRIPEVSISTTAAATRPGTGAETIDFNDLDSSDILVVDDNAVNRNLLASTFDGTHHRVRFATNGREAVDLVRAARPDIVLMDIRMPEMDGQTALEEIRKIPGSEKLPVIAVTASSIVEDEKRLRGTFAGYLRKPFTRPMLFREMAYYLPQRPKAVAPVPTRALVESTPREWPELVRQLRKLERSRWPAVRDGGVVSEAREFASTLRQLAGVRGCPTLDEYAEALSADCDSYAVQQIENHLLRFPDVVQAVDQAALADPPADGSVTPS